MSKGTATQEQLELIHTLLANAYKKALESDDVTPALLGAAQKFLKDNCIAMVPKSQSAMDEVAEKYNDYKLEEPEDGPNVINFPEAKEA